MKTNTDKEFKFLETVNNLKEDLFNLVFPESCVHCDLALQKGMQDLCPFCYSQLKWTYFEGYQEPSELDKLFWGRVPIQNTFSLFYFERDKPSQTILHNIKYNHKRKLANSMGREIGNKLLDKPNWLKVEALLPVPLHPKKAFIRGYNQSEEIAKGIAEVLKIPIIKNGVGKKKHTGSQTKKDRFDRWDNVSSNFNSSDASIDYMNIAVVDDVITTGSTLEAMINALLKNQPELQVNIISLALAK